MTGVALRHITKTFEKTTVLQDLSLSVSAGQFVVLVGPSGCGKTTALRIIAGLEQPDTGEVWIDEHCVNDVAPKDRDIAMVFQSYALYPHMSVFDNMAFALKMRKVPKAEIKTRVSAVAEKLDLTHQLNKKPRQLSGGQRQRVALGRAIVRNPKVFLMDEPLSNLDAKLRVQMRTEISRLQRELGTTTLYVTHDQVEAMTMADWLVVFHQGVIQQQGTPFEVYHHPANAFVGGFMGSMAFFKARPQRDSQQLVLVDTDLALALPAVEASLLALDTLCVGIRPEHFHVTPVSGGVALSPVVEQLEHLGHELRVYFTLQNQWVSALLPPDTPVQLGEALSLWLDSSKICVFPNL